LQEIAGFEVDNVKRLFGITLAVFMLSAATASALEIKMDVHPLEQAVKLGEVAEFFATVESNGKEGGLYVFVEGKPSHWINMGTSYIQFPFDRQIKVSIKFFPTNRQGAYDYNVVVQSMLNPEIKVEKGIKLVVLSGEKVELVGSKIEKVGESVIISMTLESDSEEEVTVEFSLSSPNGNTAATYTRTITVDGEREISQEMPLSAGLPAGMYVARGKVKDTGISFEGSVEVEAVHRIVKSEEESASPLFQEYKIKVENDGNVIEKDYGVEADIPTGFVTFSQQPENCEGGKCTWVLPAIGPQQDIEIVYRLEYWPLVAEGLLIAVLLGAFLVFGWNRATVPAFRKTVESGKGGDYKTVIEIRNAGKKITDVVVRDRVSPLFNLGGSFESLKPAIKHDAEGTELVWSIPSIEPGDHRIIHYRLTPVVSGSLKIPKASMRYSLKGKKSKVESRESLLAA
jgi:hypothetical protein